VGCGIDREITGKSLMSMAHGKPLANAPYLVRLICHPHNAD